MDFRLTTPGCIDKWERAAPGIIFFPVKERRVARIRRRGGRLRFLGGGDCRPGEENAPTQIKDVF
jgi:hypothetical protein